MDIYKKIRKHLFKKFPHSTDVFGDEYFDDSIFDILESDLRNNKKGQTFDERFLDVMSDPNNLFIKRHIDAGKIQNGIICMHNGIKIYDHSYYGHFSQVFKLNLGCHEPAEERAFKYVLDKMKPNSTMIELGAYWAFYSIWFKLFVENAKVYCVEPEQKNLEIGIKNFELNQLQGSFTKGFISNNDINLHNFCKEKDIQYVDILHVDIQGAEFLLLNQIAEMLENHKINYLFISSHSNKLHYGCKNFLKEKNYRIICDCDFDNESFQFDGFILACPNTNKEISEFRIGNRKKSLLLKHQNDGLLCKFI